MAVLVPEPNTVPLPTPGSSVTGGRPVVSELGEEVKSVGPPIPPNGSEPNDIFTTIAKGRPNGMPAFEGRIPAYQIWQLVAYVRSMSGLGSRNAAPGRQDHMRGEPPQNSKSTEPAYTQAPGPDVVVEPHFLEVPK